MFEMTVAWATTTAATIVGLMIVALFGLAAVLFVRLVMWWWDQ